MLDNKLPNMYKLIILGIIGFLVAGLAILPRFLSVTDIAGYYGVFMLSFLGSVSMVLPVPGLISMCGLSALLNPILLGSLNILSAATKRTSAEL